MPETPSKNKYAVIDLGTNTFHLLIAEMGSGNAFRELYRQRIFIKLAENGIQKIGEAPYNRAIEAIRFFKTILDEYEVSKVTAFGTAGLRTAVNGQQFIDQVFKESGITIQLISGFREAELIYKGVVQAVELKNEKAVIMDIGGGSVEFIIADKKGIIWAESFPVGVAVLFNNFHKCDPISQDEIQKLDQFLIKKLAPVLKQFETEKPSLLIGASGTFDVLENVLCQNKVSDIHGVISIEDFNPFYKQILKTNLSERLTMPDIPESRAEMIIVALILIDFILQKSPIKSISISAYAMKEGMLHELKQPY